MLTFVFVDWVGCLVGNRLAWSVGWLVRWLVGRLVVGRSVGWLLGSLLHRLTDLLVMINLLVGCSEVWFAGRVLG